MAQTTSGEARETGHVSQVGVQELDGFRKRDGIVVPFDAQKIRKAVEGAAEDAESRFGSSDMLHPDRELDDIVEEVIDGKLNHPSSVHYVCEDENSQRIPHIERVQDVVELTLREAGYERTAECFERYRKEREQARENLSIREETRSKRNITDASLLLVSSVENDETSPWDRERIVTQLLQETSLEPAEASTIAKVVENRVIKGGFTTLDTALVRSMVNNVLSERGYDEVLQDLSLYRVPRQFVDSLMTDMSAENSNIASNNPEAVNLNLAELILKQWALDAIFSDDVQRAHTAGSVHLHDLGFPHRVYCSSHSLEYIKKYGLVNLVTLNTESKPARSASVLTGHLNTFLASMQANYAGALGIAYINILYAPYLTGQNWKTYKQTAQELIFNGSQNCFSRGGQALFLDFNIHSGIPEYLKTVPAIGPGGYYMVRDCEGKVFSVYEKFLDEWDPSGYPLMELQTEAQTPVLREKLDKNNKISYDPEIEENMSELGWKVVTYGDYEAESRQLAKAMLQVWQEGDRHGRIFEFPKCDFHVTESTFRDPDEHEVFMKACELSSANGSTYFIFDRDEVTLSACCRLRTTIDDSRMLKHPESMRFCGFQNVTVNLPQAAYRASHNGGCDFDGVCRHIDEAMEIAMRAHLQKREKVADLMDKPGKPLWQIGKTAPDGQPYVDLDQATYIIGMIGLNDMLKFMTGQDLESEEAHNLGLHVVSHMYKKTQELAARHGLKVTLEESPAESASRRLAKADLTFYPDEAEQVVQGGAYSDMEYYTNSVHPAPDADMDIIKRIRRQGQHHNLIESGAITNCYVGEEQPSVGSIAALVKKTMFATQTAQITISPELCYCEECNWQTHGSVETCPNCGTTNLVLITRVVGYYSRIRNWNKSKLAELQDRRKGNYAIETADDNNEIVS